MVLCGPLYIYYLHKPGERSYQVLGIVVLMVSGLFVPCSQIEEGKSVDQRLSSGMNWFQLNLFQTGWRSCGSYWEISFRIRIQLLQIYMPPVSLSRMTLSSLQ